MFNQIFNAPWCSSLLMTLKTVHVLFLRGVDSQVMVNLFYLITQSRAFVFN